MRLTQDAEMHLEDYNGVVNGNGISDIDEQIQNAKFRVAFAHAAVGFTLTAPKGRLIEANSAYCALTGYTLEELREHSFDQLVHPDDLEPNRVQVQSLLAGDIDSFVIQIRYKHKSGKTIWVQKSVSITKDEANKPEWVIALVEDITSRKEMETAMRLNKERLTRLHHTISDPELTDPERLAQMLRLGIEEFGLENGVIAEIADGRYHVVLADTPDGSVTAGFTCDARDAICTETLRRNDLLVIESLAQTDWRNHRAYSEFGAEIYFGVPLAVAGEIFGTLCYTSRMSRVDGFTTEDYEFLRLLAHTMSTEMTRQKHESALQASEERFRAAVGAVSDIIWTNNAEGQMDGVQLNWSSFTGQRQEDYQGFGWSKAVHPEDRQPTIEAWNLAVAKKRTFEFEHRVRRQDGQWRVCSIRAVPVLDITGKIREWAGVHTDITERKQQQQEIQELNVRLSLAMAESHHRIKNHLQMLSALVEMQSGEGETVSRTALTRMSQHIQSLASLHDVLTSTSKVQGETDMISVRETLDKMHPLLQASAGRRRMVFKVEEIQISLKQAGSFMLLVNELLSNAIKHGAGDIELNFSVWDNLLRLEVCNDGPGFAPDFDPKKAANMGLELIESLGRWDLRGEVTYENREQGGARVVLTFPLAKLH